MKSIVKLLLVFVVGLMIILALSLVMYRIDHLEDSGAFKFTRDKLKISEKVLYDQDGLVFRVLDSEIDLSDESFMLDVVFENHTDKAFSLSSDLLSVNGVMSEDELFIKTMPSETINTKWKFINHDYKTINDIRFVLNFYDDEKLITSDVLKLTSNDIMQIDEDIKGELLLDEMGVKIYYQDLVNHTLYYDVTMMIDNQSFKNINVEAEVMTIDDKLYPVVNKIEVAKDQKAYLNIYLYNDVLAAYDISKLDKLSLKFKIYDYYNDEILFDSLVNVIDFSH